MSRRKREENAITPPLNALLAFESAARNMSIKKAALELSVTPSAVSHRLRVLEMMLGHELLRRVGARLELTNTGQALAPKLTAGFDHIFDAVNTVLRGTQLESRKQLDELE